jgi:aldose 1-epimerase
VPIRRRTHGSGFDAVEEAVLENAETTVSILNVGCATRDWRVAHDGARTPVVLGYDDPRAYLSSRSRFFGAIAGRVANRTAGGVFTLDGRRYRLHRNNGPHHLHGGRRSLGHRRWRMETDGASTALRLRYDSPAGEEGYPHRVRFELRITLAGRALIYDMRGDPDGPTPINLAQHSYYHLGGGGPIWDHAVKLAATAWTPVDDTLAPTGEIRPLDGGRMDFRRMRRIGEADPDREGFDHNYVLDRARPADAPAVEATAPNGLCLRLWTDQPGLQFYTGGMLSRITGGLDGRAYDRFGGVCFEPQGFPNSLNEPGFPSIMASPAAPYRQRLTVEIAPG